MTVYGNGGEAWFWLLIGLAIEWLVIWSAVRVATDRVPTAMAFAARTERRPEGVLLSVRNKGRLAAINLSVRWSGALDGEPLLSTLLLASEEEVSGIIEPPIESGEPKVGLIVVRHMSVDGVYHSERLAVLATPTTPASAIIAPLAPTDAVSSH